MGGDAVGVRYADQQHIVGSECPVVVFEFLRSVISERERNFILVFRRVNVGSGEWLRGIGAERDLRALGDAHPASYRESAGLAAQVLGVDTLNLDRGELGTINDLDVKIADAVVATDDIEVHVSDDMFELVAEELV